MQESEEEAVGSDEEGGGGRKSGQFKKHLKKNEAASAFSRDKTVAQQRRSLPVFTVREELLQVWGRCKGGVRKLW